MGNPSVTCGMTLNILQNEWKNSLLGVDSGSPLLKALLFLGVPMLTLRPEHASFLNHSHDIHINSFFFT